VGAYLEVLKPFRYWARRSAWFGPTPSGAPPCPPETGSTAPVPA